MPILDLQRTMRQLGRIRMGNQVPSGNGMRPNKLETWRLTSPFKTSLDAAAAIYGGTVAKWEGSPAGQQWELITETSSLEIIIPPGDMAFSQWMEMWSGGGCLRRCDQQIEQQSGDACMCPADPDRRIELANNGRACKPTTRLSVMQPHLPDIGLWRLETHGWYGAIELAGTIEVLRSVQAVSGLVPAKLTIEQRSVKREGKTKNFAVPVIELPTLSAHTLMTGEIGPPAVCAAPPAPAILAPAPQAAVTPARTRSQRGPALPPPLPTDTPEHTTRHREEAPRVETPGANGHDAGAGVGTTSPAPAPSPASPEVRAALLARVVAIPPGERKAKLSADIKALRCGSLAPTTTQPLLADRVAEVEGLIAAAEAEVQDPFKPAGVAEEYRPQWTAALMGLAEEAQLVDADNTLGMVIGLLCEHGGSMSPAEVPTDRMGIVLDGIRRLALGELELHAEISTMTGEMSWSLRPAAPVPV